MFEGLRKNSQSFLLVVLIASLATVFGVSFGPGARGCNSGSLRVNYIAKVYGNTVTEQDFQSVARLTGLGERRNQRVFRSAIVDGLVERELLAHEAERIGFRVSDSDLNREIRDGNYYVSLGAHELSQVAGPFGSASARQQATYARTPRAPGEPAPAFNIDDFEAWVRGYFGRTVPDYKRMMVREVLAEYMRNVVMANVRVSEDEVWRDYARQHNQVALRYLQFTPDFYRSVVRDDDQTAVDAFAAAHGAEISHQWEQRRETLHNLPEQIRIRQILLRFPENAEDPARIATRQRAESLRARIVAGEDFVRLARLYSQDEANWRSGGETGWVSRDRVDLPEDVKVAIRPLQPGQLSDPIASALGYHIVQVLGARHGDVAELEARREIARELYRIDRGNQLSTEAANHAQQLLQAQGATLDSVSAAIHGDAVTAFYRGDIPAAIVLPGNNTLEPVSHSDIGAPELRETQPFTQASTIPGIENSQPLVRAGFQLTNEHPSPPAPLAIGDDRFVVRLKEGGRQTASREDFNRDRQQLMEDYAVAKRREALEQYITRIRAEAERRGQVRIGNSPLLQQRGPDRPASDEQGTG